LLFAVGVLDKSKRILMRVIGKTSLRTKLQSTISVQLGEHIIEILTGVSKKELVFLGSLSSTHCFRDSSDNENCIIIGMKA
jgi:hypothetical protein